MADTREELDRFLTDEGRTLVAKFVAESANEPDDVDMDEVVRQNLADHEAALTGKPEKPAPCVPEPTVSYVVVNADWDPSRMPAEGWKPMTLAEAKAQKRAFNAAAPEWTKVILEVTTTYRVVGGGGRG